VSSEESIRITQQGVDEPLQVEVGITRYVFPGPVDAQAARRLHEIATTLLEWAESSAEAGLPTPEPAAAPRTTEAAPDSPAADDEPVQTSPPSSPTPHFEPSQVATPALAEEITEPLWRRLLDAILMRDQPLPVRSSLDSELIEAGESFISELESILSKRLARRDEPLGYEVRLVAGLKGQLQIVVDGDAYESVEDVPVAEVRKVLRETISEWESRY